MKKCPFSLLLFSSSSSPACSACLGVLFRPPPSILSSFFSSPVPSPLSPAPPSSSTSPRWLITKTWRKASGKGWRKKWKWFGSVPRSPSISFIPTHDSEQTNTFLRVSLVGFPNSLLSRSSSSCHCREISPDAINRASSPFPATPYAPPLPNITAATEREAKSPSPSHFLRRYRGEERERGMRRIIKRDFVKSPGTCPSSERGAKKCTRKFPPSDFAQIAQEIRAKKAPQY